MSVALATIITLGQQQQENTTKSCSDLNCHFFEYLRGRPFEEAVQNDTERDHFCEAVEQQMSCIFFCTSTGAEGASGGGGGKAKFSLEQHRMIKQLSSLQGICQSDSRQALASLDTNHGEAFSRTLLKEP